MKNFMIIAFMLITCGNIEAQYSIRVGSGYYLWGSGDLRVPTGELELRKEVSRFIDLALSANFGHFSSLSNEDMLSGSEGALTTFASNQLAIFKIFNGKYVNLSLGLGSSLRYFHQLRLSPLQVITPFESEEGTFRSERRVVYGVLIKPEIRFPITPRKRIMIGASTSLYNQSEIFSGFSLSIVQLL